MIKYSFLDGKGGYMTVYIYQNSLNHTLYIGDFIVCKLYLNKNGHKK